MKKTALEKRIKRRVTARSHWFFAVCTPGLSGQCLKEIREKIPELESAEKVVGGVAFSGPVKALQRANLVLGTPTRILIRLGRMRAEGFSALEKQVLGFEWELYLKQGARLTCDVVCRKCRLYHSDAVARRMESWIAGYLEQRAQEGGAMRAPDKGHPGHRLVVRGERDRFEISLDSSGEPLYKRGLKIEVGTAPIRESLAYGFLGAAGYRPGQTLIDPMCGSGTFSLEAAMITCGIPPGWFRTFAFEGWPCFGTAAWQHQRLVMEPDIQMKPKHPVIHASDLDTGCVAALQDTIRQAGLECVMTTACRDFFDLLPPREMNVPKGVVVLNPPYGRRIGRHDDTRLFYRRMGEKLASDFKGWRLAMVVPETAPADIMPFSCRRIPLFHGGLSLMGLVGNIGNNSG